MSETAVFRVQHRRYVSLLTWLIAGYFVSFDDSLLLVIRDSLPVMLLLVSIASVWLASIQRPEVSPFIVINGRALEALDRIRGRNIDSPRRNDMLLGIREPFLWFLAPLFMLVSVGVTIIVSKIAFIATVAITALWNKIPSFPWLGAMQWLDRSAPLLAAVFRWTGSWWTTDSRYIVSESLLMEVLCIIPEMSLLRVEPNDEL